MQTLIKIIVVAYAIFVFVLGQLAAQDNISLNYPSFLVLATSLTYIALPVGMIALVFRWHPSWIINHWKTIFLFCIADGLIGTIFDALFPKDYSLLTDGLSWVINAIIATLMVIPAYYLNFKLAYKNHG